MSRLRQAIKKIPGIRQLARRLGWAATPEDERRFLLEMLPKRSVGAEIGVHVGDFSRSILDSVSPKELHLIDPWEHQTADTYKDAWYGGQAKAGQKEMDERYRRVCNRFDREIRAGHVKVHRGYSTEVLEQFPDGYFDWIYIDGNHLYEYVKQDLECSLRKTRQGGVIAGDDYTEGGWWGTGVKDAVDEFSTSEATRLVEIRHQQFIFRKY